MDITTNQDQSVKIQIKSLHPVLHGQHIYLFVYLIRFLLLTQGILPYIRRRNPSRENPVPHAGFFKTSRVRETRTPAGVGLELTSTELAHSLWVIVWPDYYGGRLARVVLRHGP